MSEIIDLDVLLPKEVIIKFGGEELTVPPPTLADVLRLGALSKAMSEIDPSNPDELETATNNITQHLYKCVPALKDKPLNTAQLLKLSTIISSMGMPPDAKELDERGINLGDPKAP